MTPSPSSESIPSAGAIVDHFQRALRDGAPTPSGPVVGLLMELHRNNLDQWRREDLTRGRDTDDATVAAAKRDIDALNTTRHRLVEACRPRAAHTEKPTVALVLGPTPLPRHALVHRLGVHDLIVREQAAESHVRGIETQQRD